jgi:hypothetical protein
MNDAMKRQVLNRIHLIMNAYNNYQRKNEHGRKRPELQRMLTQARATVYDVAGRDSAYGIQLDAFGHDQTLHPELALDHAFGVLQAVDEDIRSNNFLASIKTLVSGELFGDFLEMASHLVEEKYKDPAAVVAGSALEAHLKQLCIKYSVPTEAPDAKGRMRPRKADTINADLVKAHAYTPLDQKNVTAWQGLRNDAAHGNYSEYTIEQVQLMIDAIRDFITRNPA